MASFHAFALAPPFARTAVFERTVRVQRRRRVCVCVAEGPRGSALDALPTGVKLNAVAESLARQGDLSGTLSLLRSMEEGAEGEVRLSGAALTSIVDLLAGASLAPRELASELWRALRLREAPGFGVEKKRPMRAPESLPDSGRAVRVLSAGAVVGTLGGAALTEIVEPLVTHHAAYEAHTVLFALLAAALYDRYAASARGWAFVADGLSRVFSDDPARAARVEAAHFLVAYVLGLPWVCLAPDERAIEAVIGTSDSGFSLKANDDAAINAVLVWMLAGAAAEAAIDGALIESDTAGPYRLLRTLRKGGTKRGKRDRDRVGAAYATAVVLLNEYTDTLEALATKMLRGESAGECVAFLGSTFNSAQPAST